ncbi:MAG: integrase, partial [Candidatus Nephrothrix sp. EaCA]
VKTVSASYADRYHDRLKGMVERQMRASIKMIGDVWYTAWVDAGQPDMK